MIKVSSDSKNVVFYVMVKNWEICVQSDKIFFSQYPKIEKIIHKCFLLLLECFVVYQIHYQASVGVKDKEGPEDEGEEEVDGVDVAGGVADVDEQAAEDDSQLRLRIKNVQPNVGYKGERAGDTWVLSWFAI